MRPRELIAFLNGSSPDALEDKGLRSRQRRRPGRSTAACVLVLAVVAAGCAPSQSGGAPGSQQGPPAAPARTKIITIPVLNAVRGFSIGIGDSTPTGGFDGVTEMYANGLFTSEPTTRKEIGLLAEKVPSLDDGSISLTPDGGMRVTYSLRKGITWQDGAPFTAQDLAFTTRFFQDRGIPFPFGDRLPQRIGSVETPDDYTFVANFKTPYVSAVAHSIRDFWPMPQHILRPIYEKYLASGNPDDIMTHPYWTSEFVHLGPFRVTSFDPAGTIVFQRYGGYFRGTPKIDVVRVQVFLDANTLYAALLSGSVDMLFESTVKIELGSQLSAHWKETGEGVVYTEPSNIRTLIPQHRPAYQTEPAFLDPRGRLALSHALDREALAEGLEDGHRELAAFTTVLTTDPLYEAAKDMFRAHNYDPARAQALLRDMGWTAGSDGKLRNTQGRTLSTSLGVTPGGEREVAAIADLWRRVGLEVEELVVPSTRVNDAEYRATFKGWELTTTTYVGLKGPGAAAENRWVGNRWGYENPRLNTLIDTVQNTISTSEQLQAMKEINELFAAEVPELPVMYNFHYIGARRGVKAFDDHEGGYPGTNTYGSNSRNAHLWDVE